MCVYLRDKFEVSSIILTSFRQGKRGGLLPLPVTSKRTPKKPTSTGVKKTSVFVADLSRQIVSYHLVILEQKLFTNRFVPLLLRCKPLLFNIPKFIFSL